MSTYNSYHTNLILLYKFNSPPEGFKHIIPKSTRYSWRNRDISEIIGCDSISSSDVTVLKAIERTKKLFIATKALYFLFQTVSNLFKNAENKVELLKLNKSTILDMMQKVQPILGSKRILKSIGITTAKFYYWLEKKRCQNSIFQLCKPRHPNQLMRIEVDTIKNYLLDERFKSWSALSFYYQALRDKAVFMWIETWYKYANRLGVKRKFFRLYRTVKLA